jgi:mRNA interferase MazF
VASLKFSRGGIYLARLDPAKGSEVGKLRPVVLLTDQTLLDIEPPHVFIAPLSSRSDKAYKALHVKLNARDNLHVESFALAEHCRSISIHRLQSERLAQLDVKEVAKIINKLQRLVGV